jgi:hypothetical protein
VSALKVVKGTCEKETVKPTFCFSPKDRWGKVLPAGCRLVATSRSRAPYVLDLLLYVNPEVKP